MQADHFYQLYQFEQELESAVIAELATRGVQTLVQHGSDGMVVSARAQVSVSIKGADNVYELPTAWAGVAFLKRWSGTLEIEVRSRRSNDDERDSHPEQVALCRWAMQDLAALNNRMNYHELAAVMETATQRAIDEERDSDVTTLSFDFGLAIKPDAWPDPET